MLRDSTSGYRRLTAASVALLLFGTAIGVAIPAGLGWDFANFYDAGRRAAAGEIRNLYRPDAPIAGLPPQGALGFFGTPISAYLYAPMARLEPEVALVAFKIENTLAYFAGLAVLFGFGRRLVGTQPLERWRFTAAFAFTSVLYQPLWTVYRVGGQTTPTVFLLLALGLVAHTEGRHALSALAFVGAVMIKPAFATGLVFLAAVSGLTFAASAAAFVVLAGLVSVAVMGLEIQLEFVARMLENADLTYAWYYNSSIFIVFEQIRHWAGGSGEVAGPIGKGVYLSFKVLVIAACAWLILGARRRHLPPPGRHHFHFSMAIVFFLLVSQTLWEHYLAVLFLLLCYLVAVRDQLSSACNRLVAAIFVLSFGQNLILVNLLRPLVEPLGPAVLLAVALLKSAPVWLAAWLVLRYRRELLDRYTGASWRRFAPESGSA